MTAPKFTDAHLAYIANNGKPSFHAPEIAKELLEARMLLRNLVKAQHAGPITPEMLIAWEAASDYSEAAT